MRCTQCGRELAEELQTSALLRPREIEVLQQLANGLTRAEIGKELEIAESTVKNMIHTIARSLQVRDTLAAVMYALRERWIALPEQKLPIVIRRQNRVP